jgi:hypothetical protein
VQCPAFVFGFQRFEEFDGLFWIRLNQRVGFLKTTLLLSGLSRAAERYSERQ